MFEKLDVHTVAVELRSRVTHAVAKRASRDLREQFGRASSSVILNLCEGAGRSDAADQRRSYVMAMLTNLAKRPVVAVPAAVEQEPGR